MPTELTENQINSLARRIYRDSGLEAMREQHDGRENAMLESLEGHLQRLREARRLRLLGQNESARAAYESQRQGFFDFCESWRVNIQGFFNQARALCSFVSLAEMREIVMALARQFDNLTLERAVLRMDTAPITLTLRIDDREHAVELGPFRIQLRLNRMLREGAEAVGVVAIEPNPSDRGYHHPHLRESSSALCMGDFSAAIGNTLRSGHLDAAADLIEGILKTYNPQSPYENLERWLDIEYCVSCGEAGHASTMFKVNGESACPGCVVFPDYATRGQEVRYLIRHEHAVQDLDGLWVPRSQAVEVFLARELANGQRSAMIHHGNYRRELEAGRVSQQSESRVVSHRSRRNIGLLDPLEPPRRLVPPDEATREQYRLASRGEADPPRPQYQDPLPISELRTLDQMDEDHRQRQSEREGRFHTFDMEQLREFAAINLIHLDGLVGRARIIQRLLDYDHPAVLLTRREAEAQREASPGPEAPLSLLEMQQALDDAGVEYPTMAEYLSSVSGGQRIRDMTMLSRRRFAAGYYQTIQERYQNLLREIAEEVGEQEEAPQAQGQEAGPGETPPWATGQDPSQPF